MPPLGRLLAAVPLILAAAVVALARQYDLLSLGDRTAVHLGVRVERLRQTVLRLAAPSREPIQLDRLWPDIFLITHRVE